MNRLLAPKRDWFDAWMRETGEAPPDFATLRSMADLPDLLEFYNRRRVENLGDWAERKKEIWDLLCKYFLGTFPQTAPAIKDAEGISTERERGAVRKKIKLRYETDPETEITLETIQPDGSGPYPVFLTQTTHRPWAVLAVSRGYFTCVYPGADADDQSAQFEKVFPECDWRTIPRRAWLAGRAIDYLETIREANTDEIAISGHSRNGKQSLIAAALDARVGSVVSSSSGSAGATPYRFASEREYLESVEFTTWMCPDWFHPRLRFFTGREHKLPIDIHGLLGMIAPRHVLLSEGLNDGCGNTFAIERSLEAARKVFSLFDADDSIAVRWRPGGHEVNSTDVHSYIDWFEHSFGRNHWTSNVTLYHGFSWAGWQESAPLIDLLPTRPDNLDMGWKKECLQWLLGDTPPHAAEWGGKYGAEKDHDAMMMNRYAVPDDVLRVPVQFAEYNSGCLYLPKTYDGSKPVIIWLHPFSFPTGYKAAYAAEHDTWKAYDIIHAVPKAGFPVFTFDQLGFVRRIPEGADFYTRYPGWSKMGKMVRDVQSAVDFLRNGESRDSFVTNSRFDVGDLGLDRTPIYCVGYSLGGMVSLFSAALDDRISGVASFCGFTPMRTDTDSKSTGGLRRFWEWYGLLPRLGLYHGREHELPFDYEDVLDLIAPRECLLVTPIHDRDADYQDVCACIAKVRTAESKLTHISPDDYSRFQPEQFSMVINWLESLRQG